MKPFTIPGRHTGRSLQYWVQKTLVKHQYILRNRAGKGVITCYLIKATAYSPAHTKRLIRQYVQTGKVTVKLTRNNGFKRAYTDAAIRLLASMDERHRQPGGGAFLKEAMRARLPTVWTNAIPATCLYRFYLCATPV